MKARRIVETGIGAKGHGSSTRTFLMYCHEYDAHLWSIDTNLDTCGLFFEKFSHLVDGKTWSFIGGDSAQVIADRGREFEPIDFLHLDGDHTYDHVKHELSVSLIYMAKKHIVTCHDTSVPNEGCGKAMREWTQAHDYAMRDFTDFQGQIFLTPKEYELELFGELT